MLGVRFPSPATAPSTKLLFYHRIYIEREEQRLEAAQMKFLRHLLGITKLDKDHIIINIYILYLCIINENTLPSVVPTLSEINNTNLSYTYKILKS